MRAAGYRGPKVFTREAIKLIANASQGLTRRVNILSDKALLAAFADGTHAVTAAEVKRAVRDSEFYRARSGAQKIRIGAGALAAGLVLGWGTHVLLPAGRPVSGPAPSAPGPAAGVNTAPVATAAQQSIVSEARSPTGPNPPAVETGAATAALATASPAQVVSTAASVKLAPRLPSAGVPDVQPIAPIAPDAGSGRPPTPPEHGDLVQERFKATQEWLRSAPGDLYAIQLATVNSGELAQLEEFLRRASKMVPAGELFVYSVKIDGQQHYRVAYGSYASPAQALAAINGLPPLFSAYHPYYRSVERMRSQNRR
jgi:septal ring-binding cell division protein DamX